MEYELLVNIYVSKIKFNWVKCVLFTFLVFKVKLPYIVEVAINILNNFFEVSWL